MIHSTTSAGKFRRLVRRLRPLLGDVPCAVETIAVGLLERLWHVGVSSAQRGDIGRFDDEEIAEMVGWHGDAGALIGLLVEEGWLDACPVHRLVIHDWHDHAPRHVKANVKKLGGFLTGSSAHKEPPCAPSDSARPLLTLTGAHKEPTPNLTKPNLTKPSPPAPPPATNRGDGIRGPAWEGVEEDVRKAGVRLAGPAVRAAREAGCTPDAVTDVVCFWRLHPGAWDAGALYQRILNLRPGQDCSDLWPAASQKFEAAASRAETTKRHSNVVAERIAGEKRRAEDAALRTRLEETYGARLDGMPRKKLVALIRERFASEADVMLRRLPQRGPPVGIVRESLLASFESVP